MRQTFRFKTSDRPETVGRDVAARLAASADGFTGQQSALRSRELWCVRTAGADRVPFAKQSLSASTSQSPPAATGPDNRPEPPRAPVVVAPGSMQTVCHATDAQFRMILDLSRMLAVPTSIDVMLGHIARTCCELLDCERASIFVHDPDKNELWTRIALGSGEIRVPSTAGIVGAAFTSNSTIHVSDPYSDPRFNPEPDRRTGFVTRNLLSAPMADLDGKPSGVVQAVNKRGGSFGEADLALVRLLGDQAGVAIQRQRLLERATEAAALRREMDLARKAQQALIPREPPNVPGLTACGWTLPASVTGGDCFDLWKLPDGRLAILVADASGHGIGPALIVSQARTLVRSLSEMLPDPHDVLTKVNARLSDDLEWGHFVTAFLGFLSQDGTLHWSSAGHGPLFVRRSPDSPLETLDPPVQPLGVLSCWFDPPSGPIHLEKGGQLYLVSDGIFEASRDDEEGEQLGVERMTAILDEHRAGPPEDALHALRTAARDWYGHDEPQDDQTIVIVRRDA